MTVAVPVAADAMAARLAAITAPRPPVDLEPERTAADVDVAAGDVIRERCEPCLCPKCSLGWPPAVTRSPRGLCVVCGRRRGLLHLSWCGYQAAVNRGAVLQAHPRRY